MARPAELRIFASFIRGLADFAGRPVSCGNGADPPDFLCTDNEGRRIGIELGEWLNQQQMAANRAREEEEDSFIAVIESQNEEPPGHVGFVQLQRKESARLLPRDEASFRAELFECIRHVDARWPENPEWHEPMGYRCSDLSRYPTIEKHMSSVDFWPRTRVDSFWGLAWIAFPSRGGAYTPKDAVDALLVLLEKKTAKYQNLHEAQNLDELYLVAYYDQGLIYNTPYFASGFDFGDSCRLARAKIAQNPGVFQKVFLFEATASNVVHLWP